MIITTNILSLLSCHRFLTVNELAKLAQLNPIDCQKSLAVLEQHHLICKRKFAGRDYFINNDDTNITNLGRKAMAYLSHRKQAVQLGKARTCYHHLAGEAGIVMFQQLLTAKWIAPAGINRYVLTKLGKAKLTELIQQPIHQTKVKTCIDFSERRPHLAGVLGTQLLRKLAASGVVSTTGQRTVILHEPIDKLFKEMI